MNMYTMWYERVSSWYEKTLVRKTQLPQQESNPWPPKHMVGALSTELLELMESKVI